MKFVGCKLVLIFTALVILVGSPTGLTGRQKNAVAEASADETDDWQLVKVQVDIPSFLERVDVLENGEIWIWGILKSRPEYWLAQINDDGTIANFYDGFDMTQINPHIITLGETRYIQSQQYDSVAETWHSTFIQLEENGVLGQTIESPYASGGAIPVPSGVLIYSNKWAEPWLTLFDTSWKFVMSVDHPFGIVADLSESYLPLSFKTVLEIPEGYLLLTGEKKDYVIRVYIDGKIESYLEFDLEPGIYTTSMCMKDGKLYILAKDILHDDKSVNGGVMGADYLICVNQEGSIVWNKRITVADGYSVLYRIDAVAGGLLLFGMEKMIAVTDEGKIVKKLDFPSLRNTFASSYLCGDTYYVFGDGIETTIAGTFLSNSIMFEKIKIDNLWFK